MKRRVMLLMAATVLALLACGHTSGLRAYAADRETAGPAHVSRHRAPRLRQITGQVRDWQPGVFQLQPDCGQQMPFFNHTGTGYPGGYPRPGQRVRVYYRGHRKPWAMRVENLEGEPLE